MDSESVLTKGMDFKTLKAFFEESVEVEHLDLTDWSPLTTEELGALTRTEDLVCRYGDLIGKNLLLSRPGRSKQSTQL